MSYAGFIAEMKAALVAAGFTETPDPRISSLSEAPRGNFDKSFLVVPESAPTPDLELSIAPQFFRGGLRLEVGAAFDSEASSEKVNAITYAQDVTEALAFVTFNHGRILTLDPPSIERDDTDKRVVWAWSFLARWSR